MNLTASAQLEYAILETLVRNGQKNSMDLALSTSEFLENFCNSDSFKCAQKWKSVLNINEDGKNDQSLSDFKCCQEFFDSVQKTYLNSTLEKRWEYVAIAVSCLKLFVEINFTGRSEISENQITCDKKSPLNWYDESFILDGGTICSVAKNVNLLVIARSILFVENSG